MASGRKTTPTIVQCVTCNADMEKWHNARKMYCSQKCKYPERYRTKPLLTPEQRQKNMRASVRNRYHRQQAIVRQYKLDAKQCADCGLEINQTTIVCIDLDHRNPAQKSFTIAYRVGKAKLSDLIAELQKCDAICRNCHAIRTHKGQHWANRLSQPRKNIR